MKLQQIFKAINLRVTTSKQSSKSFYGSDCREFIFEDCYQNEVGSFFAVPEGDVCEVILYATVKDEEKGEINLSYKWINKKFEEKREFALSKMNRNEYNKEKFVYANYAFETVTSESIMLGMVNKVSEGNYLKNIDIQEEALSEEAFLEISKLSYRRDISVKKLIEELIDSGMSYADLNEKFGSKVTEVKTNQEPTNVKKSYKETSLNTLEQTNQVAKEFVQNMKEPQNNFRKNNQMEIVESKAQSFENVKSNVDVDLVKVGLTPLPEYLDGTFEIGKGFVKRTFGTNIGALDLELSLRDRVHPKPILQDAHMVRYPGDKTVLSNLKQKTLIN